MADNYTINDSYNFLDSLRQSNASGRTLRETILMHEKSVEDPRVPKEMRVMETEKRRQVQFADEMKRLIGDSKPDLFLDNAPIGGFATNMLERLDMNVRHQPLRTYATRDVPIVYGGGALESIKGFKETYSLPKGGFIGGDTNQVRLVNVQFKSQYVPAKPLTYGLRIGYIDNLKNDMLGYDAISKNAEAIGRAHALDIDRVAYVGTRGENGTTTDVAGDFRGLLNLEDATTTDLETSTTYTQDEKDLRYMDINTAIDIFTAELNEMVALTDWDERLAPNKMIFFKEYFAWLNKTATNASNTGTPFRTNKAILQEALDGWSDAQDFPRIELVMLPYLSDDISATKDASMVSSGTNSNGRIVIYRQDPYVGYMPLPMDLTGGAIVYDVNTNAYRRNYISFVGYLMQFYNSTIRYIDNGVTRATDSDVTDAMQDAIDDTTITSLTYVSATGVLTAITAYPDTIDASLASYMTDVIITVDDALPAGTIVSAITYAGASLTASELDLEGRTKIWLSELFTETSRTALSGHAGLSALTITATISGNTSAIDTNLTLELVVSDNNFFDWVVLASKTQSVELAVAE